MGEVFQSAYKAGHSVETAVLRVHNDILQAIDRHEIAPLLALLDPSAAFDTFSNEQLLRRMSHCLGITGEVFKWFQSYLTQRSQRVCINGVKSKCSALKCGVLQGSVLGPMLFSVYILPFGDIVRQ